MMAFFPRALSLSRLAEPSGAWRRISASLGLAFVITEVEFGDCLWRRGDVDVANV